MSLPHVKSDSCQRDFLVMGNLGVIVQTAYNVVIFQKRQLLIVQNNVISKQVLLLRDILVLFSQCFLDLLVCGRWRCRKQQPFAKHACVLQTIVVFVNAIYRTQVR